MMCDEGGDGDCDVGGGGDGGDDDNNCDGD